MLLQFVVENVLSFRDQAVLSLLVAPGVEHRPEQIIEAEGAPALVLRVAALYGPNASGKSNLVQAISMATSIVLHGTAPQGPIRVVPFKLGQISAERPCRFEFEFLIGGARWSFGFECTRDRVVAEWLFIDAGDGERAAYRRGVTDGRDEIVICDALVLDDDRRTFFEFLAEGTRPNQLFVTEARERNATELNPLLMEFAAGLTVVGEGRTAASLPRLVLRNPRLLTFASSLVRELGTGVEGIEIAVDAHPGELHSAMELPRTDGRRKGGSAFEDEPGLRIRYRHRVDGGTAMLEENEESDGTRRLVELAPALLQTRDPGRTVVIDELERNLHTLVSRRIVEAFLEVEPESSGQLLFTTHDTSFLDSNLLSCDSVWFVDKGADGSSSLYSLAEFDPEQLEQLGSNVAKGYVNGRFGAIPFFGDPSRLGQAKDEVP